MMNDIDGSSEVTLRQAQLVPGWVTICEYTVLIYNQPLWPLQSPALSMMGNKFQTFIRILWCMFHCLDCMIY